MHHTLGARRKRSVTGGTVYLQPSPRLMRYGLWYYLLTPMLQSGTTLLMQLETTMLDRMKRRLKVLLTLSTTSVFGFPLPLRSVNAVPAKPGSILAEKADALIMSGFPSCGLRIIARPGPVPSLILPLRRLTIWPLVLTCASVGNAVHSPLANVAACLPSITSKTWT